MFIDWLENNFTKNWLIKNTDYDLCVQHSFNYIYIIYMYVFNVSDKCSLCSLFFYYKYYCGILSCSLCRWLLCISSHCSELNSFTILEQIFLSKQCYTWNMVPYTNVYNHTVYLRMYCATTIGSLLYHNIPTHYP